jgi:hypothetical protein
MLRIFSNNKDLSFNCYLKNKKNTTILNNLKSKEFQNYKTRTLTVKKDKIISYLSYNDFLNITQTYYKYSNFKYSYKAPLKIIDLKTSFLFYNKLLNHIQKCDCCKNNNIDSIFTECKFVKNILYPYGEYFKYEIYSNLSNVDLNRWCQNCDSNYSNFNSDEYNKFNYNLNEQEDEDEDEDEDENEIIPTNNDKNDTNNTNDSNDANDNNSICLYEPLQIKNNTICLHKNNKYTKTLSIYSVFIAELTNSNEYANNKKNSNSIEEIENNNIYYFNDIQLSFDEFIFMFYNSNIKYFTVNCQSIDKLLLSNQTYKNINDSNEPFELINVIKSIYFKNHIYNSMDANTIIELQKESNNFFSLFNFTYIINSLDLDSIIFNIRTNKIFNFDENTENTENNNFNMRIKIKVYYKSKITDISCIMYFNYIVDMSPLSNFLVK